MTLPKPFICSVADLVVRVRLEGRVPDLLDLGVRLQHLRDGESCLVVVLHAHAEGLEAALKQEARQRPGRCAHHALHLVAVGHQGRLNRGPRLP